MQRDGGGTRRDASVAVRSFAASSHRGPGAGSSLRVSGLDAAAHSFSASSGHEHDAGDALQEQVKQAFELGAELEIRGGGSKAFYGRTPQGEILDASVHRGIVRYQPAELVLTVRAGTPLAWLEDRLAEHAQMLPFEPPRHSPAATIGGSVACAMAGPRRAYAGSVRDFLLGVRCLDGQGQTLRFGGEVVKNVAGFDAFRLMAGALGTLGVLLDLSFKVLPRPQAAATRAFDCDAATAIAWMNAWAGRPLPLTATAYEEGRLYVRLEGSASAVADAAARLGGDPLSEAVSATAGFPAVDASSASSSLAADGSAPFWSALRDHAHAYFLPEGPLWRLHVPPATPPLPLAGDWLLEWGGAQRWLRTDLDAQTIRAVCVRHGGHASLFRGGDRDGEVFQPLPEPLRKLHANLKQTFDPRGILNPRRMYREF